MSLSSAGALLPIASSSTLINLSLRTPIRCLSCSTLRHSEPDHRASSKLFADAAREEAEEASSPPRPNRAQTLEDQSTNWDGDERIQDAVLRMLVDKYKPLRSGPIRSADEKLRQAPPRADEPLLPSIEGHKPWHTTFRAPSHATSSVRYGHIPPPVPRPASADDEKAKKFARESRRRTETAGRLSRARESTLDYRLGIRRGETMDEHRRPNPVSLKGWRSLVEDRIERARLEGQFDTIKGRGKPIATVQEDKNPFIAREEFLMNRIVQRQGAAPPWVEIQQELETNVAVFREVLKQSWTRRAIRMLTLEHGPSLLPDLTVADVTSLRDAEWESRERGYHDTAIEELNALVRKYNGLAPYAVRRPYYAREAELGRAYRESGEDILRGLAERTRGGTQVLSGTDALDDALGKSGEPVDGPWMPWSGRRVLQYILRVLRLQR